VTSSSAAPTVIVVSNFSKPGRGTHVVGKQLARLPSCQVVRFDAMDERGMRGPLITLAALLSLLRLMRRHPAAILLADTAQGLRLARLAMLVMPSRRYVIRYGNVFHPPGPDERGWSRAALKRRLYDGALRRADHVVVPSEAARTSLVNAGVKPASDVTVIPNGRDFPTSHPVSIVEGERPRLRIVGRLDDRKDPRTAIEALAVLRERHGIDPRLDVIGDGPDRDRVAQLARDLGLAGEVVFHGLVANPWAALSPNTVLLHPARYEGFGYVVLEAIAHGVPSVAFAGSGGPEEIIEATGGGLVVAERSAEALAEGIAYLLGDLNALRARAQAAQRVIRTRYGAAAMVEGYDELLRALAEGAGKVRGAS